MLYWFFMRTLGPVARHRFKPVAEGLQNIPRTGGGIIAANHLAVIDDALLPLTCPRMIHFMGKAEYFEGKGIVKEYIYIFEDNKVYSCGSILSDLYIDDLHTYLSQLYIYLEYRPGQRMYVYESEDKSLSIGLYPLNDGLAAVEYLKN